jgi:hypothetical protein
MTRILVMPESHYIIIYDPVVITHLAHIERKYYSLVRQAIEQQLGYEPSIATRNRKYYGMSMAFGEVWEMRCGPNNRFRVFYRIDDELEQVRVLGVLEKERNKLYLGDEEFEL